MSVSDGNRVNAAVTNAAYISRTTDSDTVGIVGLNHASSGGLIANTQQKINDNAANIASNDLDISNLDAIKEDKTNKNIAGGYAGLDGTGKLLVSQMPLDTIVYQGVWNATTNTPSLADGVGESGDFYRTNVAGTQDLGSGSLDFSIGDWVTYNGTIWEKSDFVGASSIDELSDVDTTTVAPNIGEVLQWDGSNWVPAVVSGGGGSGGTTIDSRFDERYLLSDVTSGGVIATFAKNDLIIGEWYDVTGHLTVQLDDGVASTSALIEGLHNGLRVGKFTVLLNETVDTLADIVTMGVAFKFKAATTSISWQAVLSANSNILSGTNNDSSKIQYLQMETAGGGFTGLNPHTLPAAPQTVTAVSGVVTGTFDRQCIFVDSSGGAVNVTAIPQISNGVQVGEEVVIVGTDDVNYPILEDGDGLALNGPIDLKNNFAISLFWTGVLWQEISRR
jgi:hypothetical protein